MQPAGPPSGAPPGGGGDQQQYYHHRVPSFEHRDGNQPQPQSNDYYSYQPLQYQQQQQHHHHQHHPPQPTQHQRQPSNPTPITGTPPTNPSPSPTQHRHYYPSPSSAPAHIPSYHFQQSYYPQQQQAYYPQAESSSQAQAQAQAQAASPHLQHRNSNPGPGIYPSGNGQNHADYNQAQSSATPPTFAPSPWSSEPARTASPAWQHSSSPRVSLPQGPGGWYPPPAMHAYPSGWQSAPSWSTTNPPPYNYSPHPLANPIQLGAPPHLQDYARPQQLQQPMKRQPSMDGAAAEKHGKKKKASVVELESPVHKVAAQSNLHPPRQASSAWQLFFTDTLNAAKEAAKNQLGASPGSSKDHPKLNVAHIAREAGVAYANMSPEQKAYYAEKVQESKDQYARELSAWQATLTPDDIRAENAFRAQQRKEGKSRKGNLKDPNAPKKPLSAYFLYLRSIRENPELRKEVWGDEAGTTKQSVLAAQRWRNLTDEEKRPYLAQADKDKTEYETLRRAYEEEAAAKARGGDVAVNTSLPPTPATAAPPPLALHKRKREGDDQGQGPLTPSMTGFIANSPIIKHSPSDFPTPQPQAAFEAYPHQVDNAGLGFPGPFTGEWQPHADDAVAFGAYPSMDFGAGQAALQYMEDSAYGTQLKDGDQDVEVEDPPISSSSPRVALSVNDLAAAQEASVTDLPEPIQVEAPASQVDLPDDQPVTTTSPTQDNVLVVDETQTQDAQLPVEPVIEAAEISIPTPPVTAAPEPEAEAEAEAAAQEAVEAPTTESKSPIESNAPPAEPALQDEQEQEQDADAGIIAESSHLL